MPDKKYKNIRPLQKFLKKEGYDPGSEDGIWGPNTAKAFELYMSANPKYDGTSMDPITGIYKLLPLPLRAFVEDIGVSQFNKLSPIDISQDALTEKDLKKSQLKKLREIVRTNLSENKTNISYSDYETNPGDSYGDVSSRASNAEIASKGFFDPGYQLKTTLGQADIFTTPTDTFVVDQGYNFNDGQGKSVFNPYAWKDAAVEMGSSPSLYTAPRKLAKQFGSVEGEGRGALIKTTEYRHGGEHDPPVYDPYAELYSASDNTQVNNNAAFNASFQTPEGMNWNPATGKLQDNWDGTPQSGEITPDNTLASFVMPVGKTAQLVGKGVKVVKNSKTISDVKKAFKYKYGKTLKTSDIPKDVWTHATNSKEALKSWNKGKKIVGRGEDLSDFTRQIDDWRLHPERTFITSKANPNSPNFQKSKLFSRGTPKDGSFLVTRQGSHGFIPNLNRVNLSSFKGIDGSAGVGILKPGSRSTKNLKYWQYDEPAELFNKIDPSKLKHGGQVTKYHDGGSVHPHPHPPVSPQGGTQSYGVPLGVAATPQEEFDQAQQWNQNYIQSPEYRARLASSGYEDVGATRDARLTAVNNAQLLNPNAEFTGMNPITGELQLHPDYSDGPTQAHEISHTAGASLDPFRGEVASTKALNEQDVRWLEDTNKNWQEAKWADATQAGLGTVNPEDYYYGRSLNPYSGDWARQTSGVAPGTLYSQSQGILTGKHFSTPTYLREGGDQPVMGRPTLDENYKTIYPDNYPLNAKQTIEYREEIEKEKRDLYHSARKRTAFGNIKTRKSWDKRFEGREPGGYDEWAGEHYGELSKREQRKYGKRIEAINKKQEFIDNNPVPRDGEMQLDTTGGRFKEGKPHDIGAEESKADLDGIRYYGSQTLGWDPAKKTSQADLDLLKKHYKESEDSNVPMDRMFEHYSDEDILLHLNNIAMESPQTGELVQAKYGGKVMKKIKKYPNGGKTNPPVKDIGQLMNPNIFPQGDAKGYSPYTHVDYSTGDRSSYPGMNWETARQFTTNSPPPGGWSAGNVLKDVGNHFLENMGTSYRMSPNTVGTPNEEGLYRDGGEANPQTQGKYNDPFYTYLDSQRGSIFGNPVFPEMVMDSDNTRVNSPVMDMDALRSMQVPREGPYDTSENSMYLDQYRQQMHNNYPTPYRDQDVTQTPEGRASAGMEPQYTHGGEHTSNTGGDFLAGIAGGLLGSIPVAGGFLEQGVNSIATGMGADMDSQAAGFGSMAGGIGSMFINPAGAAGNLGKLGKFANIAQGLVAEDGGQFGADLEAEDGEVIVGNATVNPGYNGGYARQHGDLPIYTLGGKTHEQGGIGVNVTGKKPVNIFTHNQEIVVPKEFKEYGKGKTFAGVATLMGEELAKISAMEKGDVYDKNTAKRMKPAVMAKFGGLYDAQEKFKNENGYGNPDMGYANHGGPFHGINTDFQMGSTSGPGNWSGGVNTDFQIGGGQPAGLGLGNQQGLAASAAQGSLDMPDGNLQTGLGATYNSGNGFGNLRALMGAGDTGGSSSATYSDMNQKSSQDGLPGWVKAAAMAPGVINTVSGLFGSKPEVDFGRIDEVGYQNFNPYMNSAISGIKSNLAGTRSAIAGSGATGAQLRGGYQAAASNANKSIGQMASKFGLMQTQADAQTDTTNAGIQAQNLGYGMKEDMLMAQLDPANKIAPGLTQMGKAATGLYMDDKKINALGTANYDWQGMFKKFMESQV